MVVGGMDGVWDRSVVVLTPEVSVFCGTRILKTSGMMMMNGSAHDGRSQRLWDHRCRRRSHPRMRNHRDGEQDLHVDIMYWKSHHVGGIYRDGFERRRDSGGFEVRSCYGNDYAYVGCTVVVAVSSLSW